MKTYLCPIENTFAVCKVHPLDNERKVSFAKLSYCVQGARRHLNITLRRVVTEELQFYVARVSANRLLGLLE